MHTVQEAPIFVTHVAKIVMLPHKEVLFVWIVLTWKAFNALAKCAVIEPNYWGYLIVNVNGNPNVYNFSLGAIEIRAALCPAGLCLGSNGLIVTDVQSNMVTPNCHMGECPIKSTYVADTVNSEYCASNHWNDASNDLCGQCDPGMVEWNGSCVNCDTVQVGVLCGFISLSFVYLFFIYKVSQSARLDGKILVYFVQTAMYQFGSYNQYIGWLGFSNFDVLQSSGLLVSVRSTPYKRSNYPPHFHCYS